MNAAAFAQLPPHCPKPGPGTRAAPCSPVPPPASASCPGPHLRILCALGLPSAGRDRVFFTHGHLARPGAMNCHGLPGGRCLLREAAPLAWGTPGLSLLRYPMGLPPSRWPPGTRSPPPSQSLRGHNGDAHTHGWCQSVPQRLHSDHRGFVMAAALCPWPHRGCCGQS